MVFRYTFLQLSGFPSCTERQSLPGKNCWAELCASSVSGPGLLCISQKYLAAPHRTVRIRNTEPPVSVEKQAVPFLFIYPGSVTGSFRRRLPGDPALSSRW